MNKKRIAALVAAGIIGISAVAIAVNKNSKPAYALTAEEARILAANVLPATVEHTGTDEDDSRATFEYFDAETKTLFEVKVDLTKGEISNIREYPMNQELIPAGTDDKADDGSHASESDKSVKPSETNASTTDRTIISRDEARDIALAKVSGATADDIREFELDDRNERDAKYELDIIYNGYKYEIEINAYTGDVKEFEREAEKKAKAETTPGTLAPTTAAATEAPTTVAPATAGLITADEAMNIALTRVAGATRDHIRDFELDRDDGRPEYEGEIHFNGVEYEFEIDATNGNVFKWEADRDDNDDNKDAARATEAELISRDRAIEIALAQVPAATRSHIEGVELDEDDGRYEWQIDIEIADYEYEINIDAYNGNILDIEIDD